MAFHGAIVSMNRLAKSNLSFFLYLFLIWNFSGFVPLFSQEGEDSLDSNLVAKNGILDLRNHSFLNNQPVELKGAWLFFPEKRANDLPLPRFQLEAEDPGEPLVGSVPIQVPGDWSSVENGNLPLHSSGTYRLILLLPEDDIYSIRVGDVHSSFHLIVNGKLLGNAGHVGSSASDTVASLSPDVFFFEGKPVTEILIEVANYHTTVSGITRPIYFAPHRIMDNWMEGRRIQEYFLFGSIVIIGLYNLAIYFLRRKDRSPLWFGVLCLIIALRTSLTGERFLIDLFPGIPYFLSQKVEFLTFYVGILVFGNYLASIFPDEFPRKVRQFIDGMGIVFSAIVLALPPFYFHHTLIVYQLYTIVFIFFMFYLMFRAWINQRNGSGIFFAGGLTLGLTVLIDILYFIGVLSFGGTLTAYGFYFFVFLQAVLLASRFSMAYLNVERLTSSLKVQAEAFHRFVPTQFLNILQKTNLEAIQSGDSAEETMSVLFCDIRSFTSISETMTPEQNFRFINEYLAHVEPTIVKNGGFVDKYIGDAIMALFPRAAQSSGTSADHALQSAMEIMRYLEYRNQNEAPEIRIGVGINTGPMMLGTVGSTNRLDTTVIGDSVNLASRLESLTKYYGVNIILSDFSMKEIHSRDSFSFREIDTIQVRGKESGIVIYDVYESDPQTIRLKKKETHEMLMTAIVLYKTMQFELALQTIREARKIFPEDKVFYLYEDRCEKYIKNPPPETWTGITRFR